MSVRNTQKGMSLVEVLLVLAILSAVTLIGFRLYDSLKARAGYEKVKFNVDKLFLALGQFYRANCYGSWDNTFTSFNYGVLNPDPLNPTPPNTVNPFPITDITASLITPGYLQGWSPNIPEIVSMGTNQYIVQFNPVVSANISVNVGLSDQPVAGCTPPDPNCTPTGLPPAGTNFPDNNQVALMTWRAQVAVRVDPTRAAVYQAALGADCVSSLVGNIVTPCSAGPVANNYLVWQRLPALGSESMTSVLAPSMSVLKQEAIQYTHDQMTEYNAGYTTNLPKYYVCGE